MRKKIFIVAAVAAAIIVTAVGVLLRHYEKESEKSYISIVDPFFEYQRKWGLLFESGFDRECDKLDDNNPPADGEPVFLEAHLSNWYEDDDGKQMWYLKNIYDESVTYYIDIGNIDFKEYTPLELEDHYMSLLGHFHGEDFFVERICDRNTGRYFNSTTECQHISHKMIL